MNKIGRFLLLIFLTTAAHAIPWQDPTNSMKIGDGTNSAKSFTMDAGLGASNPIFSSADGTEMNINIPFRAQGLLTVEGAGALIEGATTIEGDITLRDGTTGDASLIVNRGGSNPFIKWDEAAGAFVFSNDGTLEKKIGSGSGGGGGGIQFLANPSFEDPGSPILNWTSSGGTFSQEDLTDTREGNLKFARFISVAPAEYFQSDLITISSDINSGCMADFKYKQGDNAFDYAVLDASNNVIESGSVGDLTEFVKVPSLVFPCKGGDQFRLRITSTAAGTIDADEAYLGSNKGIIEGTFGEKGTHRIEQDGDSLTDRCNHIEFNLGSAIQNTGGDAFGVWSNVGGESRYTVATDGIYNVAFVFVAGNNSQTNRFFQYNSSDAELRNLEGVMAASLNTSTNRIEVPASAGDYFEFDAGAECVRNTSDNMFIDIGFIDNRQETQAAFAPGVTDFHYEGKIVCSTNASNTDAIPNYSDCTLTNVVGLASIACEGSNPATGTTCSVGDEQNGVQRKLSKGKYRVCQSATMSGSASGSYWRVVRTTADSDTILDEGQEQALLSTTDGYVNVCGYFDIPDESVEFAFKLRKEGGTYAWQTNEAASTNTRNTSWIITKVGQNVVVPYRIGGQAYQGSQNKRVKIWTLIFGGIDTNETCNASPCTIFKERGPVLNNDWINGNVIRDGVGNYSFATNAVFQANERISCFGQCIMDSATSCTIYNSANSLHKADGSGIVTINTSGYIARNGAGNASDAHMEFTCFSEE